MIKLTFIISVHNEEKIIIKSLENLLKLPYDSYEVIIGLDGCDDDTEQIVRSYCKKSHKFKYYSFNKRQGKATVINELVKESKGGIIIIHDADWIFKVKNREAINKLVSIFDYPEVGGIAESYPIQYPFKNKGFLETGVGLHSLVWMSYVKSKCIGYLKKWVILNPKEFPMLVNIFRKNLYGKSLTLGDDFERFFNITSKNKFVLAANNLDIPRMVSIGENYTINGIFNQKVRTAIARRQLGKRIQGKLGSDFFFYVIGYDFNSWKEIMSFYLVNIIFLTASIKAKFNSNITTKQGWRLRLKR